MSCVSTVLKKGHRKQLKKATTITSTTDQHQARRHSPRRVEVVCSPVEVRLCRFIASVPVLEDGACPPRLLCATRELAPEASEAAEDDRGRVVEDASLGKPPEALFREVLLGVPEARFLQTD